MAKTCDICGNKIGWKKFRCQDGVICKECYAKVSNNFTTTIVGKTLAELKKTYQINDTPIDLGEGGFQITRKVKTFLLVDEINKKFCIPGNPTVNKEYSRPEVYRYEDLQGYKLACEPELSPEELTALKEDKKNMRVIKKLKVRLRIRGVGIRDIMIISTPVRSSTYAFRQSYQIAIDLMKELDDIFETK